MIASITKGRGFGKLFEYLLKTEKTPLILVGAQNCESSTPADLAAEFENIAALRPSIPKPVRHFSIGFHEKDGCVDDAKKALIVVEIINAMGHGNCQYFAVAHGRDDPDHPTAHNHDHMHIVTNAIALDGELVRDSWDYRKMETALRKIERDFGLEKIACSWQKTINPEGEINPEIRSIIKESLTDEPTLPEWIDRLEQSSVNLRFKVTSRDKVQGVSFIYEGNLYKGGEVDYSWNTVKKKTIATPADLSAIKMANIATNKLSIPVQRERKSENALVIKLALQALGSKNRVNEKRLMILRTDAGITITRSRTNKTVLTATQANDGNWSVTGFSNIDKQDIKILSAIAARDLSSRFEVTPGNLELMRSANLKTQSLSIELPQEDRALLTKTADLAMQKLVDGKFQDESVQISMIDDVLKIRRLRPNKIILSAIKDENGEWKSIGVPNIDPLKDLKILGDVARVEVEVIQDGDSQRDSLSTIDVHAKKDVEILEAVAKLNDEVKQAEQVQKTPDRQSRKIKPRKRSNELG
jgi:Relaxase/Mobilisation nuclease domain